jgi:hypothetical protein
MELSIKKNNTTNIIWGPPVLGAVSAGRAPAVVYGVDQANGTTDFYECFLSFSGPASIAALTGVDNSQFFGNLSGKS